MKLSKQKSCVQIVAGKAIGAVRQVEVITGLVSALSDFVSGDVEPSSSLTSVVVCAFPQPLTRM